MGFQEEDTGAPHFLAVRCNAPHIWQRIYLLHHFCCTLCPFVGGKSDSVKFLAHPSQQMKLKCVLTLTDVSLVLKSMEIPSVPLTCVRHNHHPNSHPHTFHTSVPRGKQLSFISFVPPFGTAVVVFVAVVVHCFNDARKSWHTFNAADEEVGRKWKKAEESHSHTRAHPTPIISNGQKPRFGPCQRSWSKCRLHFWGSAQHATVPS